jgi:protein-disulfide isomerase
MRKICLIAAALAWGALFAGSALAADAPKLLPNDRVLGKPDAPNVVFEYFSLTCPHCAAFDQQTLPQFKKEWIDTGKAKLVYRDFPLDQEALKAAVVSRCLPPERYPAFIDLLFANQLDWAAASDYQAALARYAKLAGMSQKDFDACAGDKSKSNAILAAQYDAKNAYDIESTPSFFINGKKVVGEMSYADFIKNFASNPASSGAASASAAPDLFGRIRLWFGPSASRG